MKPFYTDDYPRASLGYIAFFSVLAVLIDAFSDPLMAQLSDSTRSKWGRRRPFLLIAPFITFAVQLMAFSPPTSLSSDSTSYCEWTANTSFTNVSLINW